jgi:DNA-binding NarL/FixJ family response regulator
MNFNIQPVTVAIADFDHDRRAEYESLLQSELDISLLENVKLSKETINEHTLVSRRSRSRSNLTVKEDEVARIRRINPLVLLVVLNLSSDDDYSLLLSLCNEYSGALVVLLADDSVQDDQLLKVLEIGARGYLKLDDVRSHLSRAIWVVGHGETWVPRKMLGNIMDHMLTQCETVH